ncbi:TolC family protein [Leptospira levettii]|uniref:TolC family protein n=2 Tax=Leptospira levettii TaxID=2023178 RepID=A0AAW5V3M4_9LEPT|nr:channel protein TolC [Leptospira levettii]MCW7464507.1 TolC family protein [Leptospira levettii]MCW7495426.1 TolC family protein [Leptospira levettii]MCW7515063.1 TolC family protein [Leptospira levettii]
MWRDFFILTMYLSLGIGSLQAEGFFLWEDCIWVGLERNAQFRLEKTKSELFPILLSEKWKQYLPKLGVHYFGIFSRNREQLDQEYRDVRIQIQQLLYDGGEIEREKQKIEIKQLIQLEEKKILREKIFQNISLAYLNANKRSLIQSMVDHRFDRYQLENRKRNLEIQTNLLQAVEAKSLKQWEVDFYSKRIHTQALRESSLLELKAAMFLDPSESLELEPGITERIEIFQPTPSPIEVDANHPLRKKNRYEMELVHLEEESLRNDWKPKLVLGGYLGRNGNQGFPLQNEIYGVSIGFQANLGGSSFVSNTQNGMQSEGNGIQRIPGYGPQAVGPGENAFQSGSINLFDEVSRDKKRYDVRFNLVQSHTEREQTELYLRNLSKSTEIKLEEEYQKYTLYLHFLRSAFLTLKQKAEEKKLNQITEIEYLKTEEEVFVAFEHTFDHYFNYIAIALELVILLGEDPFSNRYYHLHRHKYKSEFNQLLSDWKEQIPTQNFEKKEPRKGKLTPFYLEDPYEMR